MFTAHYAVVSACVLTGLGPGSGWAGKKRVIRSARSPKLETMNHQYPAKDSCHIPPCEHEEEAGPASPGEHGAAEAAHQEVV